MVARDVGEDGRLKLHALDASLVQAVGRDLHGDALHAGVTELTKHALQFHHTGRRETATSGNDFAAAAAQHTQGADGRRLGSGFIQQVAQQPDGGGLPVCPGDTHHRQVVRRLEEGRAGGRSRRAARITHHVGGQRRPGGILDDRGRGACPGGGAEVVVPVEGGATHRDEKGARRHAAAVVGDVGEPCRHGA